MCQLPAETEYQRVRRIARHRDEDVGATLKFLQEIIVLTGHVRKGPSLPDSDYWSTEACKLWSRTIHALKAVFRIRFAHESATLTQAEHMCMNLHDDIAQQCFNKIRSVIKNNKRRRLEEPRESSLLAVHVAGTIQKHIGRLKDYLETAHSWDHHESHNCKCCQSFLTSDLQRQCINHLDILENVNIVWQQVAQEQRAYL